MQKKTIVKSNKDRGPWQDVAKPALQEHGGVEQNAFTATLRVGGARDDNAAAQKRAVSAPRVGGSVKKAGGIFDRLTDTSKYTGAHKHRFDEAGQGLGKAGRESVPKGEGRVPGDRKPGTPVAAAAAKVATRARSEARGAPSGAAERPPLRFEPGQRPRPAQPEPAERPSSGASVGNSLEGTFQAYCGGKPDMDGKTFAKLCKDCRLIDGRAFTATDADLIFSKAVEKGKRRIGKEGFERALQLLAQKKGVSAAAVSSAVAEAGGPLLLGTAAEAVRFHDDKSTYTGVYKNGGPDNIKGRGTATQLAASGMQFTH